MTPSAGHSSARNVSLAKTGRKVSSWELQGHEYSSTIFNSQQKTPSALQGRLEEILVFELDELG
jgi:hypothetical protein